MSTEYIHVTFTLLAPKNMSCGSNEEIERCGAREEEEVTLPEVIQRDKLMVDTANAVLGGISDTSCTYSAGYIRQPIYACVTCTSSGSGISGVCLACSYRCHQEHELIELYTKRDFRCDCGNSCFSSPCSLLPIKDSTNDRNAYSQNFEGKYCVCHRPYPDPDRKSPEVMLQCVICEDWLHEEHIFSDGTKKEEDQSRPSSPESNSMIPEDYDEFICMACMVKSPFLRLYKNEDVSSASECKLAELRVGKEASCSEAVEPTFWENGWRNSLCRCGNCVALYKHHKISFLLDAQDTLQAYEENARQDSEQDSEEAAEKAFKTQLSHEQQVEMAMGYHYMKTQLQSYLSGFASEDKTVKAEDIKDFFSKLQKSKRQRTL
uniref:Uncharacterized protein AlNc14C225G9203 n=1 Tax=Albugo laibachii Nc14 TaxID=890382 RepID=F0WS65_9STRA|nr:conserved hypothetical protein [Albugo laibachii Nc14]CCA26550.1 conserved hypothetical protein [Albugo laibachii Nc14]|eukprot:CCA26550.1 conserved hypothetical protein [Albugo laibachii Nc14]